MRTAALGFSIAIVVAVLGCAPERPNVLLISIDTLRADHTSLESPERGTTPRLRQLAQEGARALSAYSVSATTAPAHASLFTGLYPLAHGLTKNGFVLGSDTPTLAEQLGESGYQTVAFASSFVLHSKFGFARGFDAFEDTFHAETSTMDLEEWLGHRVDRAFDRRADATTRMASNWLREHRQPERPFFMFVHYFDPHAPYDPPAPFAARFLEGGSGGAMDTQRRLYDGEIAYTDYHMGKLIDVLEAIGLRDNTLVVATSDHGEAFLDHGILRHGPHLYEEAVRIPLVFRWPGRIAAGAVVSGLVSLVDVAPTILALTNVDGRRTHGQSLALFLRDGSSVPGKQPVFLQRRHYDSQVVQGIVVSGDKFGILLGNWKYIEGDSDGVRELYDLESDPGERTNAIYTEKEEAARLRSKLRNWRETNTRVHRTAALSAEDRESLEALGYVE